MMYRVTRKYGMYEPGDLLVPTPARIKEIAVAKFAEPVRQISETNRRADKLKEGP